MRIVFQNTVLRASQADARQLIKVLSFLVDICYRFKALVSRLQTGLSQTIDFLGSNATYRLQLGLKLFLILCFNGGLGAWFLHVKQLKRSWPFEHSPYQLLLKHFSSKLCTLKAEFSVREKHVQPSGIVNFCFSYAGVYAKFVLLLYLVCVIVKSKCTNEQPLDI